MFPCTSTMVALCFAKIELKHECMDVIFILAWFHWRNPSFGLVTKVSAYNCPSQEGSLGVTFHILGNAKECEEMNLHTPKWTPILGVGISMDFWMFREQFWVKTHWIEEFLIPLKVWIAPISLRASGLRILLESFQWGYNFAWDFILIESLHTKL
jgi:hypothetical protein